MARKTSGRQRHRIQTQLQRLQSFTSVDHLLRGGHETGGLGGGHGLQRGLDRRAALDLDNRQHPTPPRQTVQ